MVQRILRLRDTLQAAGVGKSTWYEQIADGVAPAPVPVTERTVGWLEGDIAILQEARIAMRDGRLDDFIEQRRAERGEVEPWLLEIAKRAAAPKRGPRPRRRTPASDQPAAA